MTCLTKQIALSAGVPLEHYGVLLNDVKPRNKEQERLIYFCNRLLKETQDKKRRTLVVLGTVGNGKSFISCSALQTFLDFYPYSARYVTQERLVGMCKDSFSNNTSENAIITGFTKRDVRLLVIDELTQRGWSEYAKNIIERVISERHDNLVSTILIGNLDANRFKEMFDEHILSRLRLGDSIVMKAEDMRKKEVI